MNNRKSQEQTYLPNMGDNMSRTSSNNPNIIPICVSVRPFFWASAGKNGAFYYIKLSCILSVYLRAWLLVLD